MIKEYLNRLAEQYLQKHTTHIEKKLYYSLFHLQKGEEVYNFPSLPIDENGIILTNCPDFQKINIFNKSNFSIIHIPEIPFDEELENAVLSSNIMEYKDVIMKQLNINEMIVKPTSMLSRTYKPNKMELGRAFKKDAKKYEDMIAYGNIIFPECKDTFYTMELNVDMKADFVGMKFSYMDNNNVRKNAVVYLNSTTDSDNDMMAEINNIRRHINIKRKDKILNQKNLDPELSYK
jgi:hypothetical protein